MRYLALKGEGHAPHRLSTGPPAQACFRLPGVLFQPHSKDPGEFGMYTRRGKSFRDSDTQERADTRSSRPIALTRRRRASLLSAPSSNLAADRGSRYRRTQLRPRGAALFLAQCFKLRAELVRPITKRSLERPITKRDGRSRPGGRLHPMWVRVTNCHVFLVIRYGIRLS